jgi:hypothetical protein
MDRLLASAADPEDDEAASIALKRDSLIPLMAAGGGSNLGLGR